MQRELKKLCCTFDKEFLCPLKGWLTSTLHLTVRNDFIPCHLCSHLYELGVNHRETIGEYKLSPVQREILGELDLCTSLPEERKIAEADYRKNANFTRRRGAVRLEKHYLILTRKRPEPDPKNPHNWREVTKATLTMLGAIVANKMSQKVKDNPERFLLEPARTSGWYYRYLREEKNFLREARAAQSVRERIKKRKKEPAKDFKVFETPDTLNEAVRTLMAIIIETGTMKDLLRGEAIPEDPYAAAMDQIQDVQQAPELILNTPGSSDPETQTTDPTPVPPKSEDTNPGVPRTRGHRRPKPR